VVDGENLQAEIASQMIAGSIVATVEDIAVPLGPDKPFLGEETDDGPLAKPLEGCDGDERVEVFAAGAKGEEGVVREIFRHDQMVDIGR
jgi:hypothetical protein